MKSESSKAIDWYRTPVDQQTLRRLYVRSDLKGAIQTFGYLSVLIGTGVLTYYSAYHWAWWVTLPLLFLHGTCFAFQINAVHELGHRTVFKTKWLNTTFTHVFAFLGWINHRMFEASHVRHHHSTLHPPDDLEVVLPTQITKKDFLRGAFINWRGPYWVVKFMLRVAQGKFHGEWELKLFPDDDLDKRKHAMSWARTVLLGQTLIVLLSLATRQWMIPVLTTFAPFYGGWLFFLCNNTQHVGLQDNVTDFRLCCRTFIPNPVVRFLYWNMNYHTEHHMYVGVPCYNLGKLHKLISLDLPPCPVGLVQTWQEIGAILAKQAEDPTYQHPVQIPHSTSSSFSETPSAD